PPPETSPAVRTVASRAASAAAVLRAAAKMERFERQVGHEYDKTFDEIYDWKLDENGVLFWEKGFENFNDFVGKVYWDQQGHPHETGYQDPGWMRPAPICAN
ncbi:MAG: hypothetical protein ACKPKO_11700, partial [Candidatus Fonsibacter sp.]